MWSVNWPPIFSLSSSKRTTKLSLFFLLVAVFVNSFSGVAFAQYFDPELDDKTYLDILQKRIEVEVNSTREELYTQAKIIEMATKQFVAAQLKENLFIALRVLAEKELKQFHEQHIQGINGTEGNSTSTEIITTETEFTNGSSIYARQDDDDDSDSATTLRAADRAMYQAGLIPQVANLIKAIFGGNQNVNLTNYVSSATRLLPKPVGNQVVGLVSAISVPHAQPEPPSPNPGPIGPSINNVNFGLSTISPLLPALPPPSIQIQDSLVDNSDSFESHFGSNSQLGPPKGSSYRIQPKTTLKPYIYKLSGPKGVASNVGTQASITQTQKPQRQQQQEPVEQFSSPQAQAQAQLPPQVSQQLQVEQLQLQLQQQQLIHQRQQLELQRQQLEQQRINQIAQQERLQQQQIQQQQLAGGPGQGGLGRPPFPNRQQQQQQQSSNEDEDEDDDDDSKKKRQFNIGSLLPHLLTGFLRPSAAPQTPSPVPKPIVTNPPAAPVTVTALNVVGPGAPTTSPQAVTGVASPQAVGTAVGTPDASPVATAMMMQGFNLQMFATDVGRNLRDIIRVMPDLFRGAREGVQFLQTVSQLFGGFEGISGLAGDIL